MLAGRVLPTEPLSRVAGLLLLLWAALVLLRGHPRRVRVGLTTGAAGLVLWSFWMASAHGAGLMLLPALVPICFADPTGRPLAPLGASAGLAFLAVIVHGLAMLLVMGGVAGLVYRVLGLSVLRTAWINLDLLWALALIATGVWLLLA